jgi:predicted secreted protein
MRKLALLIVLAVQVAALSAGDVANFVGLGFSPDGTRYAFGQYGRTDADFRAYADILAVDVAKNDFLPGGKYQSSPDAATAGKDGKAAFQALQDTTASYLVKQGIDVASQGRALYVQAVNEPELKELSFRDFETGSEYAISVRTLSEGSGKDVRSSFYIVATVTDSTGKKFTKTIGLPGYKRPGVKDYLIRRIVTDNSGKSLVFVVEKKQFDRNGDSVRFMVETCRL